MSTNGSSSTASTNITTDRIHCNLDTSRNNANNTTWISNEEKSTANNFFIEYHPSATSDSYPLGLPQRALASPPMVIQITDDEEDDDSLAPLNNSHNKISFIDQKPITIHDFGHNQSPNIGHTYNNNSNGPSTTWIDRYFSFMSAPPSTSVNHTSNMSTGPIYYMPANEKDSNKSEVLFAMLVATVVALGAVFYSAWITAVPHSSVVASGTSRNDDNSSTTALSHNNSGSSCDYLHNTPTFASSLESIFTTLATGFIASIIAVTFFSKMNISLTFDSHQQQPTTLSSSSSSGAATSISSSGSTTNTTKSVPDIQATLVRLCHAMVAAFIVSILTYIIMNYNHTIVGKIITALYLLFLGM